MVDAQGAVDREAVGVEAVTKAKRSTDQAVCAAESRRTGGPGVVG